MGRIIGGGIVGAIVVFIWGVLAWPVLHLYDFAINELPDEAMIVEAWENADLETGAYYVPGMSHDDDMTDEQRAHAVEDWAERHRAGPIGLMHYRADGRDPMHWSRMAMGFGFGFVASALLATLMVGLGLRSFVKRFGLAFAAGLFAVLASELPTWNWFYLSDAYALARSIDVIAAWTLGGLAIAAIARPRPAA